MEHRPVLFVVLFAIVMGMGLAIQLYGVALYRRLVKHRMDDQQCRWKYVRDGADMLFDVVADPGERNDLVYKNPAVVEDLKERLAAWEREVAGSSQDH